MSLRKSPSQHASQTDIGTIKKGLTHYWMVLPVGDSKRWVEVSAERPKVYHPIYNGEEMKVIIGDARLFVFHRGTFIDSFKYSKLFIPKARWLVPPRTKGARPPGDSTLLAKTGKKKYVYIDGHKIAELITYEDVLSYESPMGNAFVPYAYATTRHFTYMILDKKTILNPGIQVDPYSYVGAKKAPLSKMHFKILYDVWSSLKVRNY